MDDDALFVNLGARAIERAEVRLFGDALVQLPF